MIPTMSMRQRSRALEVDRDPGQRLQEEMILTAAQRALVGTRPKRRPPATVSMRDMQRSRWHGERWDDGGAPP